MRSKKAPDVDGIPREIDFRHSMRFLLDMYNACPISRLAGRLGNLSLSAYEKVTVSVPSCMLETAGKVLETHPHETHDSGTGCR